jgi:hypothetical protein
LNRSPTKTYRRFLLGIASEEEQSRVEAEVLTGDLDAMFLENAEDELIDDYVLGSITSQEKRGFEEQFLITEQRRQKLRFASALIKYSQQLPADGIFRLQKLAPSRRLQFNLSWKHTALLSAAAMILLAVLSGLEWTKLRQQAQVAQETQKEIALLQIASAANSQRTAELAKASTGNFGGSDFAANGMPVIEFASTTRTIYPVVFHVPAAAQFARIDWRLPAPFAAKYREVLLSGSGQQLWAQEFPAIVLSPARQSTMVLPASILVSGTYHLRLEGSSTKGQFEELGDCVLRVVRP